MTKIYLNVSWIAYAAFVWSRELVFTVFTTWLVSINTSAVVNTTREFEKIFASPFHKLWRKMAANINKLGGKEFKKLEFTTFSEFLRKIACTVGMIVLRILFQTCLKSLSMFMDVGAGPVNLVSRNTAPLEYRHDLMITTSRHGKLRVHETKRTQHYFWRPSNLE